jgi:hypothetical protein
MINTYLQLNLVKKRHDILKMMSVGKQSSTDTRTAVRITCYSL